MTTSATMVVDASTPTVKGRDSLYLSMMEPGGFETELQNSPYAGELMRAVGCALLTCVIGACSGGEVASDQWAYPRDSTATVILTELSEECNCLSLELVATMGEWDGAGSFVEDPQHVVRDGSGNYWVSQRGHMLVFDSKGAFLRQVGQAGEGPMEFEFPRPVHADSVGRVHVWDRNLRETIVNPDFTLAEERRWPPSVMELTALSGHRYAVNGWMREPSQLGYPVHTADGDQIVASYGVVEDPSAAPLTPAGSQRVLTADHEDRVFSAKRVGFDIEAWTADGRRIRRWRLAGEEGERPLTSGLSLDEPPPRMITALRAGEGGYLWVLSVLPRRSWRDALGERLLPNGVLQADLKDGASLSSLFFSRLEVVDLSSGRIVGSEDRDEFLHGFVGEDALEVRFDSLGVPELRVWRVVSELVSERK